jgi:hypothetical protein
MVRWGFHAFDKSPGASGSAADDQHTSCEENGATGKADESEGGRHLQSGTQVISGRCNLNGLRVPAKLLHLAVQSLNIRSVVQ